MNRIYYSIILLISGCVSKQDTPSISYFSKEILRNIIHKSAPATIQKTVAFNDSTESKLVILDSLSLKKELGVFYQLDLNTAEFAKIFTKKKVVLSEKSYQLVYQKVPDSNHNIKSVVETYVEDRLVAITGNISQNTLLFFSEENIEITISDDNTLSSYTIDVEQGLVAQDTNFYKVTGILK